jgi:D-3-phosphoglycerate dehydrogenase
MEKLTILIESRPFCLFDQAPLEQLKQQGFEILDMRGSGLDEPAFVEALAASDIILCGNDLTVDETLFEMAPRLKAVAKQGAGIDTIDISAATRRKLPVFHTPGANNQAVADHTFALILAVARRIHLCHQSLRDKRWEHTKIMGTEIWQKTLGLIGLGAIGRCVALRAGGFQMRVVATDPYWPTEFAREHGIEQMALDEVLAVSDVVSIHSPLTPETRAMIDGRAFGLMKPTAILVNAARGGVVDEAALCKALESNQIAGAGIDVFEDEPPTDSPLLHLDNVVLTPHTAAFTHDAMNNMNVIIVDQIIEFAHGRRPAHLVNSEVWEGEGEKI